MDEKQIIETAMRLLAKRSNVAQKNKYGSDYSKEMQRRSLARFKNKKVEKKQEE